MSRVISIVSYQFLPAKVGGQKNIALFYKYLSRLLFLLCVTTKNNSVNEAQGYEVINLFSTSPLRYVNPFYFFSVKRILQNYQATHLMIEHPYFGWLAYFLKGSLDIKLIVHSHNIEGLRWKSLGKWWWKILWRYERFTHRHADFNFFIQQQDMEYAIREFGVDASKCMMVTYGIERNDPPPVEDLVAARAKISALHGIQKHESIFLFNGSFDYKPNLEALHVLLNTINPMLNSHQRVKYKLLICGRSIPEEITKAEFPNVIIAGFADDIDDYFRSADVFLNPILEGGGIKTKLVEALGNNCNAVSTVSGAIGVDPAICNGKLLVAPDDNWKLFSEKVVEATMIREEIGPAYFAHFYWGYNAARAARFIETKSLPEEA